MSRSFNKILKFIVGGKNDEYLYEDSCVYFN